MAHSANLSIECHLSLVRDLQAVVHTGNKRLRFMRAYTQANLSFLTDILKLFSLCIAFPDHGLMPDRQVKSCRFLRV